MNKTFFAVLAALTLSACVTAQNQNAVVGTGIGAAAGGLLGSQFGSGTGKLVGVGLGTLLGAGLGHQIGASADNQNQSRPNDYKAQAKELSDTNNRVSGEDASYNRGRSEYESEQQRLRENRAYQRGRSGQ